MSEQIIIVPQEIVRIVEVAPQGTAGPQGPPGEPGGDTGRVTQIFAAGTDTSGHRAVYASEGVAWYASADEINTAWSVAGISTHATETDADLQVLSAGPLDEISWNWIPDRPVYLGLEGRLTQTFSEAWAFRMVMGYATGVHSMLVRMGEPTIL